jgi:hypothetical protein
MSDKHSIQPKQVLWAVLLGGVVAMLSYGCQESSAPPADKASTMPTASSAPVKGGAQLWSETCMRCHSLRRPTEFSNAEWAMIVHHMRVRANLTGEESDRILTFIKSANTN